LSRRVEALKGSFESEDLDGYLVSNGTNMRYLSGFLWGSRLLIPKEDKCTLYVHMVNYQAAKEYVKDMDIEPIDIGEDADKKAIEHIKRLKFRYVGFDSLDASAFLKMREDLENSELKPLSNLVGSLRRVKDEDEVKSIRRAAHLTSLGMKRAHEVIKPGLEERELASEVEYAMRREGSDGVAFDTIVASGVYSAFPHGGRGDRRILEGDIVVIDIGAKYHDYCADLTRTLIVGGPSPKQRSIYEAVLSAQENAMKYLKAGIKASAVDGAARDSITERGYGEYFVHGLGHGVGLEIHEPPTLGPKSVEILEAGNVVTVEPGVYIPGFGGVRIEDTVLVKKDGAEKLTVAPYTWGAI